MKLYEFSNEDLPIGFYNPANDKLKQRKLTDTRKPKLTLRHLTKLKRLRAMKKLENLQRQDLLGIMYGIPVEPELGGGLGGGDLGPPPGGPPI